jgi:hypothetical protein
MSGILTRKATRLAMANDIIHVDKLVLTEHQNKLHPFLYCHREIWVQSGRGYAHLHEMRVRVATALDHHNDVIIRLTLGTVRCVEVVGQSLRSCTCGRPIV